jgi:hypothetical protein
MRMDDARPIYDRAMQTPLTIDDELAGIIARADRTGALREAERIAGVTGNQFSLRGATGENVSLNQLDRLKKSLYDIEQSARNEFGGATEMSRAVTDLRRQLTRKLDQMTTDPRTGQSVYAEARAAYAEPAQLNAALELGRTTFSNRSPIVMRETMAELSPAEQNAFRIGAFESFRDLAGTPSGQTQLLNLYKDRTMREKMQALFPNEASFRDFARGMIQEEKFRKLESVIGGSSTARNLANAQDAALPVEELVSAAGNAAKGNVPGLITSAKNLLNNVTVPRAVRDEIGRLLLAGNQQNITTVSGQTINPNLTRLQQIMQMIESRQPTGQRVTSFSAPATAGLLNQ